MKEDACRFHPSCMGMTIEEAKKLDHFLCSDCVSEEDAKKAGNTFSASPMADGKVKFLPHLGIVRSSLAH